jgi:hypothetical protein
MPNSGRCAAVYLCVCLHVTNDSSDRQFGFVVRSGYAPNADYFQLTQITPQGGTSNQKLQFCTVSSSAGTLS